MRLMSSGKATPVIHRTYPLQEVPAAIRYLEQGRARQGHHHRGRTRFVNPRPNSAGAVHDRDRVVGCTRRSGASVAPSRPADRSGNQYLRARHRQERRDPSRTGGRRPRRTYCSLRPAGRSIGSVHAFTPTIRPPRRSLRRLRCKGVRTAAARRPVPGRDVRARRGSCRGRTHRRRRYRAHCHPHPRTRVEPRVFLAGDNGLLFTGDHLMSGSTVVIISAGSARCGSTSSSWAPCAGGHCRPSPRHGAVIPDAIGKIDRVVEHRLAR